MGTRQNHLDEAVLTSTHNLCFEAKIRKIGIPLIPQFCYIKVGHEGYTFNGHVFLMNVTNMRWTEHDLHVTIVTRAVNL